MLGTINLNIGEFSFALNLTTQFKFRSAERISLLFIQGQSESTNNA